MCLHQHSLRVVPSERFLALGVRWWRDLWHLATLHMVVQRVELVSFQQLGQLVSGSLLEKLVVALECAKPLTVVDERTILNLPVARVALHRCFRLKFAMNWW